jgi:NDP-sugar pyrophosphorylase family protein
MKAMILAAGLGTRLRPLTDTRPKALVELNGRTLVEITLTRLQSFGVTEAVINVHHHAQMVVDYLHYKNNFGMRLEISREDDQLLDTGGGLKKAAWFFQENPAHLDDPFILHNVDVISAIDLAAMLQFHVERQALATLAVQSRESSRQLLFDDQLQLSGRQGGTANPGAAAQTAPSTEPSRSLLPLAFSGIHILSPHLLPQLTESTPAFSIIDSYLRLSSQSQRILAFRHEHSYWRDLGKPADLAQAAQDLQSATPPQI